MRPTACDTAILLFSRSAVEEAVAKPLLSHDKKRNLSLTTTLIRQVRRLSRQSGFPVFFISEHRQQGDTFGERFAHAFQQVFDKGFSNIVCIGNDCPALEITDLYVAAEKLQTHALVIGPATDGGAYLIGLQKAVFNADSFSALRWQTAFIFDDLIQWNSGSDFCCLDTKSDLDSGADLRAALRNRVFSLSISARISALLQSFAAQCYSTPPGLLSLVSTNGFTSRGPPHFSP